MVKYLEFMFVLDFASSFLHIYYCVSSCNVCDCPYK